MSGSKVFILATDGRLVKLAEEDPRSSLSVQRSEQGPMLRSPQHLTQPRALPRIVLAPPHGLIGSVIYLSRWLHPNHPDSRGVMHTHMPVNPTAVPVTLSSPHSNVGVNLRAAVSRNRAQSAWGDRSLLLLSERYAAKAQHFIRLAREHAREGYTVPEAAVALDLTVRSLTRHSLTWFSYSPGVLIDLARIFSVSMDLEGSEEPIKSIAISHGFGDASTMARLFVRFVRVAPGAFRRSSKR
jgi:AraC-like DNA-binding protein